MIIRVITIVGYVGAMICSITSALKLAVVENKAFLYFLAAAVVIGILLFMLQLYQSMYSDSDEG